MFSNYKFVFLAVAPIAGMVLSVALSTNGQIGRSELGRFAQTKAEDEPARITGECIWLGTCYAPMPPFSVTSASRAG